MKNTIKFLTAFILSIAFSLISCDKVESLADIDFNSSLTGTFNLNFDGETDGTISESLKLDLASDDDISEYLNKLKKIKITKITYEISKFDGDQYVDMNAGLYLYEEKNNLIIVAPQNYNLDSETSVEYEITDSAILELISTELLSKKQIELLLKGDYQSLPQATAEITVTVYFDVTANPL
jgi:hypothetical protein